MYLFAPDFPLAPVQTGVDCNAIDPGLKRATSIEVADRKINLHENLMGDLFGIVMTPDGTGFYYVQDDQNTVVLAH